MEREHEESVRLHESIEDRFNDMISPDTREKMRIDRSIWKDPRRLKRCMVYVIAPEKSKTPCKIGVSRNPHKRLGMLQVSHWQRLRIFQCGYCFDDLVAEAIEREAHKTLEPKWMMGEWFDVLPEEAIEVIKVAASTIGVDFRVADPLRLDKAQKI